MYVCMYVCMSVLGGISKFIIYDYWYGYHAKFNYRTIINDITAYYFVNLFITLLHDGRISAKIEHLLSSLDIFWTKKESEGGR